MALRASRALRQSFDLLSATQKLTPAARSQVFGLKKQYDDLKRELEASAKDLEPINWDKYTKAAGNYAGVVNLIKADHDKVKLSPINYSAHINELNKLEGEAIAAAEKTKKEAELRLQALESALKDLQQSGAVDELNVHDVLKQNPQWSKDFKNEIENDKFL